ncbi:MAG: STAS domain-containing protein [Verrucomicrobiota bacterium]
MITHNVDSMNQELVVQIPGDLLSSNVAEISGQINEIKTNPNNFGGGNWKTLTLDLCKARMVDSIGLNMLVSLIKDMKSRGGNLKVVITSKTVYRTFLATRLDKLINVVLK